MSTPDTGSGSPVDDETFVREHFGAIAGHLMVDGSTLVGPAVATGLRQRRRRRWQQGVGAAAVVAVLAAAGVLGVRGGLFQDNATQPSHGSLTELVPATPRGLAEAVIADLPSGLRAVKAGGLGAAGKAVEADLQLSADSTTLWTAATRPGLLPLSCHESGLIGCRNRLLANGDRLTTGDVRGFGSGRRTARLLALQRDNDAVLIIETSPLPHPGAPMPIPVQALLSIAEDPLVGMETSSAMNEKGQSLHAFARSARIIGAAGPSTVSGSSSGFRSGASPKRSLTTDAPSGMSSSTVRPPSH